MKLYIKIPLSCLRSRSSSKILACVVDVGFLAWKSEVAGFWGTTKSWRLQTCQKFRRSARWAPDCSFLMIVAISLTSYSRLTGKPRGRAKKRRDAGQDCDNHDAESSLGGQQHNDRFVSWKLSPWWGHWEAPAALGGRGSGPEVIWPLPGATSPLLHARDRGCGFLRLQALHERWLLENDVAPDGVHEGDSWNGIQLCFLSEFPSKFLAKDEPPL